MPSLIPKLVALVALVGLATPALAQSKGPILTPLRPLNWDVSGGWGFRTQNSFDSGADHPETHGEFRLDVGRYWSTHLKTEVGVSAQRQDENGEFENIPVPGSTVAGWAFTNITQTSTTFTPAVTYQFFENVFAHPFVSAGARVTVLDTHTFREQETRSVNRIAYTVPGIDMRAREVVASPFVAAGFKSYFNERTFLRSELLASPSLRGADRLAVRVAFGVDF